jgi:hypothetical protein
MEGTFASPPELVSVHGEEDSLISDIDKNFEVKRELPHEVELGQVSYIIIT